MPLLRSGSMCPMHILQARSGGRSSDSLSEAFHVLVDSPFEYRVLQSVFLQPFLTSTFGSMRGGMCSSMFSLRPSGLHRDFCGSKRCSALRVNRKPEGRGVQHTDSEFRSLAERCRKYADLDAIPGGEMPEVHAGLHSAFRLQCSNPSWPGMFTLPKQSTSVSQSLQSRGPKMGRSLGCTHESRLKCCQQVADDAAHDVEECTSHGDDIFLVLAAIGAVAGLLGACPDCKTQLWTRLNKNLLLSTVGLCGCVSQHPHVTLE